MTQRALSLAPVDAWFFRDGRPYNEGEANQAGVESVFPPYAPTVVGALRAALARGRGWSGQGKWDEACNAVLGDGFDDLGALSFQGPFMMRKGETVFPMPHHLLGMPADAQESAEFRWMPQTLLTPGEKIASDLGEVCFPEPAHESSPGLKEGAGLWITKRGLERVLRGERPENRDVILPNELWHHEARVGLARDRNTRTVGAGALYSPRYVRLHRDARLWINVVGVPDEWEMPGLFPLGGEGRMAACLPDAPLELPESPEKTIRESGCAAVVLLTPLCLPVDGEGCVSHPGPGEVFPGIPGTRIVTACVGRPFQVGGWNSIKREPLPLRPFLSAGSIWFCEIEPGQVDVTLEKHGAHIGEKTRYGFGQILLGAWPKRQGDAQ